MNVLYSAEFPSAHGTKRISVVSQDVTTIQQNIDILTTSAFPNSYKPTPGTLFESLYKIGINVNALANEPYIDLRHTSYVWLSKSLFPQNDIFEHIGCIEFPYQTDEKGDLYLDEERMLGALKSYFHMLDIATASGVTAKSVALPLLGTGSQQLSQALIITPLLSECVAFLKRNEYVQTLLFVERDAKKAQTFAQALQNSYALLHEASQSTVTKNTEPLAFISYTATDIHVANELCEKLEANGIKTWYAPRNVEGAYAAAIARAIAEASYFIVILSKDSMSSEHMLNEIDLAFRRLPHHIKFKPLRIDDTHLTPSFDYYLSRQHWINAQKPPLSARLDEFVSSIVKEVYSPA